jgi:nicotinate-nucleotide pyrophosphorylase
MEPGEGVQHVLRLAERNVELEKERKEGSGTRKKNVILAASGSVASIKVLLLVEQLSAFANVRCAYHNSLK